MRKSACCRFTGNSRPDLVYSRSSRRKRNRKQRETQGTTPAGDDRRVTAECVVVRSCAHYIMRIALITNNVSGILRSVNVRYVTSSVVYSITCVYWAHACIILAGNWIQKKILHKYALIVVCISVPCSCRALIYT